MPRCSIWVRSLDSDKNGDGHLIRRSHVSEFPGRSPPAQRINLAASIGARVRADHRVVRPLTTPRRTRFGVTRCVSDGASPKANWVFLLSRRPPKMALNGTMWHRIQKVRLARSRVRPALGLLRPVSNRHPESPAPLASTTNIRCFLDPVTKLAQKNDPICRSKPLPSLWYWLFTDFFGSFGENARNAPASEAVHLLESQRLDQLRRLSLPQAG